MTHVSSAKAYRTLFLIVKGSVVLPVLPVLGPEFTISTCKGDMYQEEEILCLADDHKKNRHLSPDGALFDEAGENTEIIGGGDQSDCGGLLAGLRPDPEADHGVLLLGRREDSEEVECLV